MSCEKVIDLSNEKKARAPRKPKIGRVLERYDVHHTQIQVGDVVITTEPFPKKYQRADAIFHLCLVKKANHTKGLTGFKYMKPKSTESAIVEIPDSTQMHVVCHWPLDNVDQDLNNADVRQHAFIMAMSKHGDSIPGFNAPRAVSKPITIVGRPAQNAQSAAEKEQKKERVQSALVILDTVKGWPDVEKLTIDLHALMRDRK